MAIEIVDLPINSMVIFHGYVSLTKTNKPLERLGLVGPCLTPKPIVSTLLLGPISW